MLIAPTVLGQEVGVSSTESSTTSTDTATTSVTAATTPSAGTSTGGAAASEASSEATVATTNGGSQSTQVAAETTPQPQVQTSEQPAATSASTASSSSSEDKAPKAVTSSTSPLTPVATSSSSNSNQATGTEVEPQMMEVEQYKANKEKTELTVKDGNKLNSSSDKKLIRNRDGEQRDIFDIKREVKTNSDGTIDVTVTVTPKEIDKGADVMALLDVSKKMSEDDFNNAKDKIKKLVTTLTSKSTDSQPNHNARNSVRLMTFYRKVNEPIELTAENVDAKLKEVWEQAKKDWDWGVDLQGAIHKAREIFNKEKEKNSGKRQHIVLFSQGEATFSYDINDKDKNNTVKKNRITGKVTTSNPLFPGLPIFNHTNQKAEIIDDVDKLLNVFEKLGIRLPSGLRTGLQTLSLGNGLIGSFVGGGLTEYLTLKEYDSEQLNSEQFDYTKRVGEGYYHHSYSRRTHEDKMPLEEAIRAALESSLPKLSDDWFFGILKSSDIKAKVGKARLDVIMQVLNSIFYKREYHYYNHNLSAIAEAKMAQKEGITFYSVDVTDSDKASKRVKRQVGKGQSEKKKEDAEKDRNKKFDDYLKKMSEGGNAFFNDVDKADKFKDTLTELTIKDEFEDKVTVETNSEGKKIIRLI